MIKKKQSAVRISQLSLAEDKEAEIAIPENFDEPNLAESPEGSPRAAVHHP